MKGLISGIKDGAGSPVAGGPVVVSVNVSPAKGTPKKPVEEVRLITAFGIEGDAHASGAWHRQVSLLALEGIERMRLKGLDVGLPATGPGDFAENITTCGIDLARLPVGARLRLGDSIEVEVSQIGKVCHGRCAVYERAGNCIMPAEGIFAQVLKGGVLKKGDAIKLL